MITIFQTGGKQYLVKANDIIRVEKLPGEVGSTITFDTVLLRSDETGDQLTTGMPTITDAKITGTITKQGRADKIRIVKFKNKIRYRRTHGHRQPFTEVKIDQITS